jgi:hypothetical protein
LLKREVALERGKRKVLETRRAVERGWHTISHLLAKDGHRDVSQQARTFIEQMPPPLTAKELLAAELVGNATNAHRLHAPAHSR